MDLDAKSEETKLQRQLKSMEREKQAHSIHAQQLIHKQRQEIDKLLKQQKELRQKLGVRKSSSQVCENTERFYALMEQEQMLDKDLERERQDQEELQREMSSRELKLAELRKGASDRDTQRFEACQKQKTIRTLQNKVDLATTSFNAQQTKNRQLREEIQELLSERGRLQQQRKRLIEEKQELCKSIREVIDLSTAAYKDRAEDHSKKTSMAKKVAEDVAHDDAELMDLKRVFAYLCSLKEFVTIKCSKRSRLDDDREMEQLSKVKEQQKEDIESLDALEQVFERIHTVTGEENLDMLVSRFIHNEDHNFALLNFINERNGEIKTLKNQVSQIQEDMEQLQVSDLQQQHEHHSLLRNLDAQQMEIEYQAERNETQASIISEILDEVIKGVDSTFTKMGCDCSVLEDTPGSLTGITKSNIVPYLVQLEEKTNELLTVQAFLSSKEKRKGLKLSKRPSQIQSSMQPAVKRLLSVECDADEYPVTDEEERPLSLEEFHKRVNERDFAEGQGVMKSPKITQ